MSDSELLEAAEITELARHRAERGRRLRLAVLTSVATKPLATLITLITVPLFLKYLTHEPYGDERYGLFQSIGAVGAWLALSNAGLALGLTNRLPECYVSGDTRLARRYVSTQVVALATIALTVFIVFTVVTALVPWNAVYPSSDPLARAEIPWAVWAAGATALAGLVFSLPSTIYIAYQEIHRNNFWDAATKVAILAASVAVVYTRLGMVGVILAVTGVPVLVRAINTYYLFRVEKPYLSPHLREFDGALLRSLLTDGISFFVLSMSLVALYQTDKLIISIRINPKAVVGYSILGQLFITVQGLFMLGLAPMWPAYGEAARRGDLAWVKRSLRWSLLVGCLLMGACSVALLLFGDALLKLWTRGDKVHVSQSLILAMAATFMLRIWVDCRSIVLNAVGVLKPQMILFAIHAGLNLVVCLIVAPRYGVEGVAWTTVITGVITSGWGYPWMIARFLKSTPPAARSNPSDLPRRGAV